MRGYREEMAIVSDRLERLGEKSLIQHGKHSDRIYLMRFFPADYPVVMKRIEELLKSEGYGKVFVRVPSSLAPLFLADNYVIEGYIPNFYPVGSKFFSSNEMRLKDRLDSDFAPDNSKKVHSDSSDTAQYEDAIYLSRFIDSQRRSNVRREQFEEFRRLLQSFSNESINTVIASYGRFFNLASSDNPTIVDSEHNPAASSSKRSPGFGNYQIGELCAGDADNVAQFYGELFSSYPFPIDRTDFILKQMGDNVRYFAAFSDDKIAAAASTEINPDTQSAEMTDFATAVAHRGNRLSQLLLGRMEQEMAAIGVRTVFTIARLASPAMNRTFLRFGYRYSGTFVNNTQIAGEIESMNLFYKQL